jgi:acyl-CoA thioester hydrolase
LPFVVEGHARWGDVDFNGHMRNTAFLDLAADARMLHFAANGFDMRVFEEQRFGPVIVKDELDYHRELRMLEPYTVDLESAGFSADFSRFCLRNTYRRGDAKIAARVTSTGVWLDLGSRRPRVPPDALIAVISLLPHTDDYAELPTAIRVG